MQRYEPYYADDTQGVHFEVGASGAYVQAHVSKQVLASRFQPAPGFSDWAAVYRANKEEIDVRLARRKSIRQDHRHSSAEGFAAVVSLNRAHAVGWVRSLC